MSSLSKVNLRQIATVFLVSITLFFSVTIVGNNNAIAAEAITRDMTNLPLDAPVGDDAYQAMKAGRQQEQARRSQKAEAQAEAKVENESISEKLNLDEALPRSTKKFIDQVTEDEPINNETRP